MPLILLLIMFLTVLLESGNASFACEPLALQKTTAPVPSPIISVLQDNRIALSRAPSHPKLILLGDSLIRRWPATQLALVFPNMEFFNYGMESDRTQNLLWRLNAFELSQMDPGQVVLMVGTNNLSDNEPACAIVAGISSIISKIDSIWSKPYLVVLGLLPRGEQLIFADERRRQVNKLTQDLMFSRGNGYFIEFDKAISCGYQSNCANFSSDHLHLSQQGYEVIGAALGAR